MTVTAWLRYDLAQRMLPNGGTLLEIGPGVGGTGMLLARRFDYTAVEIDEESWETAVGRINGRVLHGDISAIAGEQFDVVCALEVLEHIEDDIAELKAWRSLLAPGGTLLLSVPAGKMGPADVKVGHFRRYTMESLKFALTAAGFSHLDVRWYGFPAGVILDLLRQQAARRGSTHSEVLERTKGSGRWLQPGATFALMTVAAAAPFMVMQRPFRRRGSGMVASAQAY